MAGEAAHRLSQAGVQVPALETLDRRQLVVGKTASSAEDPDILAGDVTTDQRRAPVSVTALQRGGNIKPPVTILHQEGTVSRFQLVIIRPVGVRSQ